VLSLRDKDLATIVLSLRDKDLVTIVLSLWDENHSPIEAPRIKGGPDTNSLSVHQRHHLGRITLPGDVDFLESSIGFFQIAFGELHR
jgi:hypothetical protein